MLNQKGFAPVVIVATFLIVLILIGGGYYFMNYSRQETPPVEEASVELQAIPETNTEGDLVVKGDKVFSIQNGKEVVLFNNVVNVSQAKYGPDGKTVHFKVKDLAKKSENHSCANIGDPIYPADEDYPNPPPTAAPWDFQKISSAGTISGCNNRKAGGFLDTKNYFAYVEITPQKKASLFLEDLTSNQKIQINLPDSLAAELSIDPKTGGNKFSAVSITGKNGNSYLYPQGDLMTDERLLLGINRLLLTANYKTKQVLKDIRFGEQSSIVEDSYSVINKNGQPYAIIVGAWEGPETYEKIIDISSDNVKDIDLYPKYRAHYAQHLFKVDPLTWEKGRMELNIVGAEPVTKSLSPELIKKQEVLMENRDVTSAQWDSLNQEAATYLRNNNQKYKDYACSLAPGRTDGECYGLLQIDHYQYTTQTGFQKI